MADTNMSDGASRPSQTLPRDTREEPTPDAASPASSRATTSVNAVGSPSPSIATTEAPPPSKSSTLATTASTSNPGLSSQPASTYTSLPTLPPPPHPSHDTAPLPTHPNAPVPTAPAVGAAVGHDAASFDFGASPHDAAESSERTSEERTAEARAALLATLANVGAHATFPLEQRATDFATNTAVLQKQEEAVRAETEGLARITGEYAKVADEARGKLKELGHVQNWAEMLERDLLVLEETMRIVEEEEEEEGNEGGGDGKGKRKVVVPRDEGAGVEGGRNVGEAEEYEGGGNEERRKEEEEEERKKGWKAWW